MIKVNTTFTLLQAITAVVVLATILWSIGTPFFRTAEAANVTEFSNTLSDSAPLVGSNHTLSYITSTGVVAGGTITLNFPVGFGGIDSLVADDIDLNVDTVERSLVDGVASGADWNVTPAGQVITLTSGSDTIDPLAVVTIRIGTNAISGATGSNQITNPAVGTYEITLEAGLVDTGATRVAIVESVKVTASVDTVFNFTVTGVADALAVNGDTTTVLSTATTIPFGTLVADTPSVAAQDLVVSTNAANGFVVTVQTDQQLTSATGADIDGFVDGTYVTTPALWASPTPALGLEDTYGHWGITSDDTTQTEAFGSQEYVSASTTPVEIFRHSGPTDGSVQGIGTTRVGYAVEISPLQEAGDDYTATLTYVATPVF
jgi:hypothetical protein